MECYVFSWIYSTLPENKQMLALSATYPEYLAQQLTAYMRNPTFLRLNITDPALLGDTMLLFSSGVIRCSCLVLMSYDSLV